MLLGPRIGGNAQRHATSMTSRQLQAIIELGETDKVEFKRKFSGFEKIAKEMIALANTRGGLLLIGVDDDGTVIGVDSEKHEIELITTAGEFYSEPAIDADIEVIEIEGVDVIAVHIAESQMKPHRMVNTGEVPPNGTAENTRVYIRQGERSMLASREVVRVLEAASADAPPLRIEIGQVERALFDYLEEHERITLKQFQHIVNISERRASRTLVRLVRAGLIRIFTGHGDDYYTLV
jgi:predicted HTH transcriptional regulator